MITQSGMFRNRFASRIDSSHILRTPVAQNMQHVVDQSLHDLNI